MKVALIWLINEKDEVLLARRASHLDTDAGVWGPSVSGGVDEGETYQETVVREAQEEIGLTPGTFSPIHLFDEAYDHEDGKGREFGVFYARVDSSVIDKLALEPDEVAEVRWATIDVLEDELSQKPETIIISSATTLWDNIVSSLRAVTV